MRYKKISWLWLSVPTIAFAICINLNNAVDILKSSYMYNTLKSFYIGNGIVTYGCVAIFIGIIIHNVLVGERIKNIKK